MKDIKSVNPGPATILLAEDDPGVRGFVHAVLEQAGYEVLVGRDGRESLEMCNNHAGVIQALITDVVMPEINGRELAERARILRPDLRVIFISGYVDRGIKDENANHPTNAFLEKPFAAESLLAALEKLCVLSPAVLLSRSQVGAI